MSIILINSLDIVQKRFREPEDTSVNVTQKENRITDGDKIWGISKDHDEQYKTLWRSSNESQRETKVRAGEWTRLGSENWKIRVNEVHKERLLPASTAKHTAW